MSAAGLCYHRFWLLLGWLLVLLVIYMTLTPHPPRVEAVSLSDKLQHTIGYLVLMGWFVQIYRGQGVRLRIGALLIMMGILLEFLQGLGGVRVMELADMAANGLGVLIGWLLARTPLAHTLRWFERRLLRVKQYDERDRVWDE